MLFNSYEFLLLFLPVTLAGFFWLAGFGRENSVLWLSFASLVFYGWWSPKHVWLLLFSIVANFAFGRLIGDTLSRNRKATYLTLAIATNLALLGFFKYADFLIDSFNNLTTSNAPLATIILPLGISFFTFTQIAYLVDVYRGIVRDYRFSHYLLFVTYFPHLIAGPVIHHAQMMPQFSRAETYNPSADHIAMGLSIFVIGLVKKVLLADNFADYSNPVFRVAALGVQPDLIEAWTGALSYSMQLYFDFSGYCDMAIGLSLLFGISLPINFNSPYKAPNIIEFWRRWHMTLSRFLRDYLYIPIGGSRKGKALQHLNVMVTMVLGGLWHGANWTFVVWGALHGMFLIANRVWQIVLGRRIPTTGISSSLYRLSATILTFLCVVLAWIVFRAESMQAAVLILKGCFGFGGISLPTKLGVFANYLSSIHVTLPVDLAFSGVFLNVPALGSMGGVGPFARLLLLGLIVAWFAPNCQQIFGYAGHKRSSISIFSRKVTWRPTPFFGVLGGALFYLAFSKLNKVSPFLYYQF